MSIWKRWFGGSQGYKGANNGAFSAYGGGLWNLWGVPSKSGTVVNHQTAMGLSALWCGIKVISQDIASLEPIYYKESKTDFGVMREHDENNPLYSILCGSPNPEQTRPVFFETGMFHALLWGSFFAEIERDNGGNPLALWLIHPRDVQIIRDETGALAYRVTVPASGQVSVIPASDMIHIPGLSEDGFGIGSSLLRIARETIGFGLAAQQFGQSYFANSCKPSGVLQTDGVISEPGRENLSKSWQMQYGGTENVGKIPILEEGLKFTPMPINNEQGQYAELLNFLTDEIARFLVISPTKLFSLQRATWGNLSALNLDHLTTTIRPWLIKIEEELERKLIPQAEKADHYIEFDTSTLLRAEQTTLYANYAVAISAGFLTVDEVRAKENLPPKALSQPKLDGEEPPISQDGAVNPEPQVMPLVNNDLEASIIASQGGI